MNLNTCYTILGIAPDADRTQAKRAYKAQVKRWHPDQFPDGTAAQSAAEERLKQINIAYARIKAHLPARDPACTTATGAPFSPSGRRTHADEKPSDASRATSSWVDHLFTMLSAFAGGNPQQPPSPSSRVPEPNRKKNFSQVLDELAGGAPASASPRQRTRPAAGNRRNGAAYGRRKQRSRSTVDGISPIQPVKPVRRVRGIGKSR